MSSGLQASTVTRSATLGVWLLAMSPQLARSEPVHNASNSHWYEHVDAPAISWVQAKISAESRFHMGIQGHLATLATEPENNFIFEQGLNWAHDWIGGEKVAGQFTWITGEAWSYTRWGPGEPNGDTGTVVGVYWRFDYPTINGGWDDRSSDNTDPMRGYIVEYDGPSIPTLSEWGMMAMAALLMLAGGVVIARHEQREQSKCRAGAT